MAENRPWNKPSPLHL